jgi:predicted HAD superfamily Cof-like phosphohydrolase
MGVCVSDVEKFHEKFGCYSQRVIGLAPKEIQLLRLKLLAEEVAELITATTNEDIVEIADGIADVIYVAVGMALANGIPLDAVWDEVQRSNMAKVGGATRQDGKVLKPEGWQPPNIEAVLFGGK